MSEDKQAEANRYELPEEVVSDLSESLIDTLLTHRNDALVIDASKVNRIDTPCIEVLLSAAKLWGSDRCELTITDESDAFVHAYSILGLEQSNFNTGGQ